MQEIINANPNINIIFEYNKIFMEKDITEVIKFLKLNSFNYFKMLYGDQGSFDIENLDQTKLNSLQENEL